MLIFLIVKLNEHFISVLLISHYFNEAVIRVYKIATFLSHFVLYSLLTTSETRSYVVIKFMQIQYDSLK